VDNDVDAMLATFVANTNLDYSLDDIQLNTPLEIPDSLLTALYDEIGSSEEIVNNSV
jgi:hypothetical protein